MSGFDELLQGCRDCGDEWLTDALTGESIGKETFLRRIGEAASYLNRAGLKDGERVVLMMDNSLSFATAYFAITAAGGIVVPVNTALRREELAFILGDTKSAMLLAGSGYAQTAFQAACDACRTAQEPVPVPAFDAAERHNVMIRLFTDAVCDLPAGTAMMMYTSGTTGKPKGVMLSYDNLLSKTQDIIRAHALTQEDTVLCVLPWFHINGLVITLLTGLASRQRIVIGGRFSVSRFWNMVDTYRVTWFSGVPTMYSHLLSRGIPAEIAGKTSLRFARSASSPLAGSVLSSFEEQTGIPLIESYGITEGCAQITSNPLPPQARKIRSVGLPYGNEIMVADEKGCPAPVGVKGEVWIRGDNITCGYYHRPEENEKSFTDGWFHSGDVGYLDEDGYLFLDGRIKELINRAGEKFSPIEIDDVLYMHPAVELTAAVGKPDEIYGEIPVSYVKLKEGCSASEEELRDWCRPYLASFKVPQEIHFTDTFPQGGNGKIQRLKLLERRES